MRWTLLQCPLASAELEKREMWLLLLMMMLLMMMVITMVMKPHGSQLRNTRFLGSFGAPSFGGLSGLFAVVPCFTSVKLAHVRWGGFAA